jgi:hypothetical protein
MANLTPSKTSFILHKDALYQDIQILSMEERGILLTAILEYQINGKIIEVDRVIQIALNHIIAQFTVDKNRYVDKCKKNQENAKKRWQQQSNATAKTDVPDDATVCDGIYYDAKHAYTDSVTEPYTDSVTEPYTDSVTEPYTDSVTEPYTDSVTEPYTDSVTEPYTDSVTEPYTDSVTETLY